MAKKIFRDAMCVICNTPIVVSSRKWRDIVSKEFVCSPRCAKALFERRKENRREEKRCAFCGNLFKRTKSRLTKSRSGDYFCSQSCAASVNGKRHPKRQRALRTACAYCGVVTSNEKYCSRGCANADKKETSILRWKSDESCADLPQSIRIYLIEQAGNKCSLCGWGERHAKTGRVPVEIDHIDGDSTNNKEDNLRVLCPNCHSLTDTYRALNKGNCSRPSKR